MNAECFAVGVPPQVTAAVGTAGGRSALIGQAVGSFGFPELLESPWPRYMHGHIQRLFRHRDVERNLDYEAYELGFPAFPGQSGSPAFLDGLGDKPTPFHDVRRSARGLTELFSTAALENCLQRERRDPLGASPQQIGYALTITVGSPVELDSVVQRCAMGDDSHFGRHDLSRSQRRDYADAVLVMKRQDLG